MPVRGFEPAEQTWTLVATIAAAIIGAAATITVALIATRNKAEPRSSQPPAASGSDTPEQSSSPPSSDRFDLYWRFFMGSTLTLFGALASDANPTLRVMTFAVGVVMLSVLANKNAKRAP